MWLIGKQPTRTTKQRSGNWKSFINSKRRHFRVAAFLYADFAARGLHFEQRGQNSDEKSLRLALDLLLVAATLVIDRKALEGIAE